MDFKPSLIFQPLRYKTGFFHKILVCIANSCSLRQTVLALNFTLHCNISSCIHPDDFLLSCRPSLTILWLSFVVVHLFLLLWVCFFMDWVSLQLIKNLEMLPQDKFPQFVFKFLHNSIFVYLIVLFYITCCVTSPSELFVAVL